MSSWLQNNSFKFCTTYVSLWCYILIIFVICRTAIFKVGASVQLGTTRGRLRPQQFRGKKNLKNYVKLYYYYYYYYYYYCYKSKGSRLITWLMVFWLRSLLGSTQLVLTYRFLLGFSHAWLIQTQTSPWQLKRKIGRDRFFAQKQRVIWWSGYDSLSSKRSTFSGHSHLVTNPHWAVNLKHSSTFTNLPVIPWSMLINMLSILHLPKLICRPNSFWSVADVKRQLINCANSFELRDKQQSIWKDLPLVANTTFQSAFGSRERKWNNERDTCRGVRKRSRVEWPSSPHRLPVDELFCRWTFPCVGFGCWLLAVRMLSGTDARPQWTVVVPVLGCWRAAR